MRLTQFGYKLIWGLNVYSLMNSTDMLRTEVLIRISCQQKIRNFLVQQFFIHWLGQIAVHAC
jgi:hypothetical protein